MSKEVLGSLVLGFIEHTDLKINFINEKTLVFECAEKLVENFKSIKIMLFCIEKYEYKEFEIREFEIKRVTYKEFSYEYEISIRNSDESFISELKQIDEVISFFSDRNLVKDFSFIEKTKEVYPIEKDSKILNSYEEQIEVWTKAIKFDCSNSEIMKKLSLVEWAFTIHEQKMYNHFLQVERINKETFFNKYLEKLKINNHPFFEKEFQRLYIGNEFCPNQIPSNETILKIVKKALKEKYKVTIAYPYLMENNVEKFEMLVDSLVKLCEEENTHIEMTVNDWGVLQILNKYGQVITPILGRLLNKRKKDPRFKWKWKPKDIGRVFEENGTNNELFFRKLVNDRIERFEYEAFGIKNEIQKGSHSLHFPFYQMMTSTYCPLYYKSSKLRKHINGDYRKCEKYCSEVLNLYPSHLSMLGVGNSIFGFNSEILENCSLIAEYMEQGIDRLVCTVF